MHPARRGADRHPEFHRVQDCQWTVLPLATRPVAPIRRYGVTEISRASSAPRIGFRLLGYKLHHRVGGLKSVEVASVGLGRIPAPFNDHPVVALGNLDADLQGEWNPCRHPRPGVAPLDVLPQLDESVLSRLRLVGICPEKRCWTSFPCSFRFQPSRLVYRPLLTGSHGSCFWWPSDDAHCEWSRG